MKKIIAIAFAALLAGFAISCQKEELSSEKTDAAQYTFNISVNDRVGFDNGASTKGATYKSGWENGDRIFLFFQPASGSLLTDTYATLTYDGSSWGGSVNGSTSLGDGGTLTAVYVYKLGNSVTPSYSDNKWTIATGNVFFNCQTGVEYSVSGSEISATLNLVAPSDFVQFYVEGATGALTCDKVKGWKDMAIGSDMSVSNITCTGYMEGFTNSGDSNVKEYYGRIINNETSLNGKECKFSVVKDGKVYERTATPSSDARSFKMTVSTTDWSEAVGKLPGLFTVGKGNDGKAGTEDDVIVHFSKGNLYAKNEGTAGSLAWKWHFYDEQYQYNSLNSTCDEDGYRMATANDSEIDLFTWGYDNTSTNTSYSLAPVNTTGISGHITDKQFSASEDWGYVFGGESSVWRTLSTAEWRYLINKNDENIRKGKYKYGVTVCDKANCLVLAPDGWDLSKNPLQSSYGTTSSESNPMTWEQAKAAGLVCLPAAGRRSGSDVSSVGVRGRYWSSTAVFSDSACIVYFDSGNVAPDYGDSRGLGFSVRLITESK